MTNQPLLEVRDLQTVFELDEGTVKAVDGVSFNVYPGRVLGIVGESGCGKSVTIKSVLRLIEEPGRIANGAIRFRSKILGNSSAEMVDLVQLPAKSAQLRALRGNEIALIPQEPMAAFSPVHTIGNQLMEVIQLHQPVSDGEAKKNCGKSSQRSWSSKSRKRNRSLFLGTEWRASSTRNDRNGPHL